MGKTALVRRFLEQLRANEEDVVVLSGRCYERESVPYKALDSVVDRLTRYLRGLSELEAEVLLPRDVRALARLFPMLGEVEAVGRASERGVEIRDSQELRRRGFAAFRELIGRLSDQGPVVMFIDDLQWGDDDSIVLLTELMRPPDAPAILLILCYRSEEETSSATLRALFSRRDAASPEVDVRDLEVGEMGQSEARQLAMSLLKDDDGRSRDLAETIAQESHGSPFFLDALVRHWQSPGRPQTAPPPSKTDGTPPFRPQPTVESLIVDRIAGLSPAARRLVEILAVFGQPLQVSLASRAADLEEEELGAMAALRVERLTRTRFTDRGDEMEVYHERIRETVLALLSPPALKAYHRRLATALEEVDWADSETLAWHFSEAGDRDRATNYAVRAADRAREAMAFDRAARLYRSALAMGEAGDNERTSGIQMRLGDVLAGAGRGYEAAVAYLAAARGALVAEQLELKRRAADQLFRSGYMNEGYGVMGSVLDALGMKLAGTPVQARLSFLRQRVLVRLSGLRFHERDRSQISAEELVRVDACWSVAIGLGLVDAIRGADFQARHLLLALKAGDPLRIARALAVELPYASLGGPRTRRRTERLAAVAEQVVARVSDPSAVALLALAKGAASFFQGRWRTTRELLDRAEAILREKCTGVAWELNAANFYLVLALFYLGEVRELRVRVPSLLKQAEERDDLAGTTNLRTRVSYLVSLADDEPAHARADVQEGMARWPRQTFHSQHSWELYAQGEIHLYEGHGVQAWDLVSRTWPALRRSALLRIQNVRIESYYLRARCALGASLDPATRPDQRTVLRRCAWRDIGRLARENSPWATAVSDLVGAAAALAEGHRDSALSRLRTAEDAFSTLDMPLHGAVAKRRRGALIDGSDGRVLVEEADAWMSAQTIRSPAKFAAMLAPGPSEFADVRNRT
jgi:tetratricopeptide (TPR) repeat protein